MIDTACEIVADPKPPDSSAMISPPGFVARSAAASVRHGVLDAQDGLSTAFTATKER
jgi:hypothetical protein